MRISQVWIPCVWLPGFPDEILPGILPRSCKIMEDYPGNPGILPRNLRIQESYQEIQDFSGILAGILGILDSWQEIENFPGSQTLGWLK